MKRTLFKKYFSALSITIAICVFLLGIIQLYFLANYFRDNQSELMLRCARKGAEAAAENYEQNGFLSRADLEAEYSLLADTAGGAVAYCGLDGVVTICAGDPSCLGRSIPATAINTMLKAGWVSSTYNSSLLSGHSILAGVPVVIDEQTAGYVVVLSSLQPLVQFISRSFLFVELVSLVILGIAAGIIYTLFNQMLRPLREISSAAMSFGKGDFSARIEVHGNNEVSELGRVFNRMADDLNELEMSRRSFMGNLAHELRTPMTTIGGYIDGILDGTIPPDQQEKYLRIVSDEVKRLSRLASSTLAVARMEETSDHAALTPVNVREILMNVMFSAERRITAKSLEVEGLDLPDIWMLCNADMMHQVLFNLVDNAVKYTPEGGTISFAVETSAKRSRISIRNTGPGISKEDMPRLFDRFFKTDRSRGLDRSGAGLGLYIIKTLVTKMGGDITVSSVEGSYSEFTVELAAAAPPKHTRPEDKEKEKEKAPQRPNLFGFIGKGGKRQKDGKKPDERAKAAHSSEPAEPEASGPAEAVDAIPTELPDPPAGRQGVKDSAADADLASPAPAEDDSAEPAPGGEVQDMLLPEPVSAMPLSGRLNNDADTPGTGQSEAAVRPGGSADSRAPGEPLPEAENSAPRKEVSDE